MKQIEKSTNLFQSQNLDIENQKQFVLFSNCSLVVKDKETRKLAKIEDKSIMLNDGQNMTKIHSSYQQHFFKHQEAQI